jgi:surface antigen
MRKAILTIAASSMLVTGCANMKKEDMGALAGAVVGIAVGSLIGDGGGQAAAMIVGAAIGGMAGTMIGHEMDETDRLRMNLAAAEAANQSSPGKIAWRSNGNEGVSGYAEPISPARVIEGNLCKEVRSVYVIEGQEKSETSRFCFQEGKWAAA